jgi:hypothetical protein
MTSTELEGKTVAFLTAQEGVEEVEPTEPWKAVQEAGAIPKLIAPESGEVQTFNHLDRSSTYPVDKTFEDVDPDVSGSASARPADRLAFPFVALGRVAERLNALVLKTSRRAIPASGVRIPPLP